MPFASELSAVLPGMIDLLRVKKRFAFPAGVADSAFLRREIADRMHERLAMIKTDPETVLDAGCGEGADLSLLQARFPRALVMGVDASEAMLRHEDAGMQAVCADFGRLPLISGSVGMLWSNLALHWHPEPLSVFAEWKRVLHSDGLLMFSCFGPETFSPLREAFRQVEGYESVLPFMEMHDLGDSMVKVGFVSPVLDREIIHVTYEGVEKLLSDVRAFGGNVLHARRRGLLGKKAYGRLLEGLESQREVDGRIHLPFEVIYGHAFCFHPEKEQDPEFPVHFFRRG